MRWIQVMAVGVACAMSANALGAAEVGGVRSTSANVEVVQSGGSGEADAIFGACCFEDGSCCILGPIACHLLGGEFQGVGTNCDENPCGAPQEILGACCLEDGSCCILGPFTCEHIFEGVFQGFGTWCDPDTCNGKGEDGACCLLSYDCVQTNEDQCLASGGTFYGNGSSCLEVCCEIVIDFETELDGTPLVNGQDILSPDEFGNYVWIGGYGSHNDGAAIFDSDPNGPNADSNDEDLLVDSGNVLILQANNSTQTVPGIFDVPNDSNYGGGISFQFDDRVTMLRVTLIDIDSADTEGAKVSLFDVEGRQRVYHVPAGWTADGGYGVLDLTTIVDQPGYQSAATMTQDADFEPQLVVTMDVTFYSSAALDDVAFCQSVLLPPPPPTVK